MPTAVSYTENKKFIKGVTTEKDRRTRMMAFDDEMERNDDVVMKLQNQQRQKHKNVEEATSTAG